MEPGAGSTLLTKNKLGEVLETEQHYLEAVKAFARLTYESVYLIDYTDMSFEYVSENPLFLCGYSAEEVLRMGYEFYFRHVPAGDLELLTVINEKGFDFYAQLSADERKLYSITYDFHLVNKEGKEILINHRLTPLFLTEDGRLWKSMCIVSLSRHQAAGNVRIYKQGSDEVWELAVGGPVAGNPAAGSGAAGNFVARDRKWVRSVKPVLTEREIEVLRLHAQGFSIHQIAEKIFVAPDTVKYYRRRIFERLEVNNIMDALSYAVNSKLI